MVLKPIMYVIKNVEDDELWWHENDGWVGQDTTPSLYSEADRVILRLPDGGEWMMVVMG